MAGRGDTKGGDVRPLSIRGALESSRAGVMIAAACIVGWRTFQRPQEPTRAPISVPSTPLSLVGAPVLGDNHAPVAIMLFSDFQCSYCARLALETLPALQTKYFDTGLVQLAFRHLPMSQRQFGERAAQGSVCAGEQGKFWRMHDALFRRPGELNETEVRAAAEGSSIDLAAFDACMETPAKRINDDIALARKLQITATPMLFLGLLGSSNTLLVREVVPGARPSADLAKRLDLLLKVAGPRSAN
jgi:protein-disulfide isomerase